MAHRISINNGRAEMAYTGEAPWHGLGTRVDALQSAQEMLKHAGLLWTVSTRPLAFQQHEGGTFSQDAHGFRVVARDDNHAALGVVSKGYQPIQNTQAGDVVDALVTEGGAHVEVAGALDEGHRCWMLAQIPGTFEVVKGDEVRPYILCAWGHDGKHGLAVKRTSIRVVCNNTLTAAIGDKWSRTSDVFIKHSSTAAIRIEEAREALKLVRVGVEKTVEAYRHLAGIKLRDAQVADYFSDVFPRPVSVPSTGTGYTPEQEAKLERWTAVQERIAALYQGGAGVEIPGVRGTAWGAYNAVTEYIDHVYPVLQSGKVSADRQESAAFGSYATTKGEALTLALAL